jgi:hypothetical protein
MPVINYDDLLTSDSSVGSGASGFDINQDLLDAAATGTGAVDTTGTAGVDLSSIIKDVSSGSWNKAIKSVTDMLGGDSKYGTVGQLAGTAALSYLLNELTGGNNVDQNKFAGYRKPIPTYEATRTQNPIPTTATNAAGIPLLDTKGLPIPRRPGSGGITYFTPMQYTVPPPVTAPATTTKTAANGGLMDGYAQGGISTLGGYSDGGRLLRGPGDGVSDSIPASIEGKQPARLADGEFVIPARIVSELGNGSTEAGARKLYAMMDRIQKSRGKTVGNKKVAVNSRADKHLPA